MDVDAVFDHAATARDLLPNPIATHVAVFVQANDPSCRSRRNVRVPHPTGIIPHGIGTYSRASAPIASGVR